MAVGEGGGMLVASYWPATNVGGQEQFCHRAVGVFSETGHVGH